MDLHHILNAASHAVWSTVQAAPEAVQAAATHATEAAGSEGGGGVLGTLGINWKLFVAQLVNFGVILLVLWKWVFTPVAKKLEERTGKIEKSLQDAGRIEKEKKEFQVWKDEEFGKARKEASAIMTAAQSEARKQQGEIMEQTRQQQEKLVQQAREQIEAEKQRALAEVKTEVADMVTQAAEKILRKKLDAGTDTQLIRESLKAIR